MLTSLLASVLFVQKTKVVEPQLWFMFFLKGDGKRPIDPKELEKMQADHIKNLQTQGGLGHLLAAGPLTDPTQLRRGITVAVAKDRDEVESFFKTDAFVKAGIMSVTAAAWETGHARFNPNYDKNAMEEYELLITTQGLMRGTRNSLRSFAVGGRTEHTPSEKYQFLGEVWISRKTDHDKLLAALDGTSAPREIIPLWMAKDILKPKD
jgi:uncharacterized protein YciI